MKVMFFFYWQKKICSCINCKPYIHFISTSDNLSWVRATSNLLWLWSKALIKKLHHCSWSWGETKWTDFKSSNMNRECWINAWLCFSTSVATNVGYNDRAKSSTKGLILTHCARVSSISLTLSAPSKGFPFSFKEKYIFFSKACDVLRSPKNKFYSTFKKRPTLCT